MLSSSFTASMQGIRFIPANVVHSVTVAHWPLFSQLENALPEGSTMARVKQTNVTVLINRPHGNNRKCHKVTLRPDPLLHSHTDGKSNFLFVTRELSLKRNVNGRRRTPSGLWNWEAPDRQSRETEQGCLSKHFHTFEFPPSSLPFSNNEA